MIKPIPGLNDDEETFGYIYHGKKISVDAANKIRVIYEPTRKDDMTPEQSVERLGSMPEPDLQPGTAPKVTPAEIEAEIASEHYFTACDGVTGHEAISAVLAADAEKPSDVSVALRLAKVEVPRPLALLTFCVLVLRNGFTVTGESACASPENFNAEKGREIARQHAVEKVWPLLGFALRNEMTGYRPMQTTPFVDTDKLGPKVWTVTPPVVPVLTPEQFARGNSLQDGDE